MRTNEQIIAIFEDKMRKKDISISELARRVNLSKSSVSRYFSRTREFPLNRTEEFAKALNLEPSYILGFNESDRQEFISIYSQLEPIRQDMVISYAEHQLIEQNNIAEDAAVHLHGETAAGAPIMNEYPSYHTVSANVPEGGEGALLVQGDSMEPLIKKNSIIFYKKQPVVENGEVAIIELNGSEVTCKKFYFNGRDIILRSINDKYEDMIVNEGVRIIGKAIL